MIYNNKKLKKTLKDEYTTLFLLFINLKQWLVILANNIIHTRLKLNVINIHLRLFMFSLFIIIYIIFKKVKYNYLFSPFE